MANANQVQELLRFLTQQAKLPLTLALGNAKSLQAKELTSASSIAESDLKSLAEIFGDEKLAKQVFNAAKRTTKKRAAGDDTSASPTKKKKAITDEPLTPAEIEKSLELPESDLDAENLNEITLFTNRAPLVLAFAVTLLKYTMPEQPLSSRLSLAQAVVSANSRSKAVSIGIESGKSAEEEGWGEGQPVRKIMGREIRVLTRWGYEWKEEEPSPEGADADTQSTLKEDEPDTGPALWGLDLEAMRTKSEAPHNRSSGSTGAFAIHTAQSARHYLVKSFDSPTSSDKGAKSTGKTQSAKAAEKEKNLGRLLRAIDLLYQSWSHTLEKDELDRRAWGWYVRVRPDVEHGVAGWGGKGPVKLSEILSLRRE